MYTFVSDLSSEMGKYFHNSGRHAELGVRSSGYYTSPLGISLKPLSPSVSFAVRWVDLWCSVVSFTSAVVRMPYCPNERHTQKIWQEESIFKIRAVLSNLVSCFYWFFQKKTIFINISFENPCLSWRLKRAAFIDPETHYSLLNLKFDYQAYTS